MTSLVNNDFVRTSQKILTVCGITKNLTFYLARHTFATAVTLSKGVPIETVSKMLEYTNIQTTQIYAPITIDKIFRDYQRSLLIVRGGLNRVERL